MKHPVKGRKCKYSTACL